VALRVSGCFVLIPSFRIANVLLGAQDLAVEAEFKPDFFRSSGNLVNFSLPALLGELGGAVDSNEDCGSVIDQPFWVHDGTPQHGVRERRRVSCPVPVIRPSCDHDVSQNNPPPDYLERFSCLKTLLSSITSRGQSFQSFSQQTITSHSLRGCLCCL